MRNIPRALIKDNNGKETIYEGSIKSLTDNYCFVECIPMRCDIYGYYNNFEPEEWLQLTNRTIVSFKIGFTMRGPVVVDAKIKK